MAGGEWAPDPTGRHQLRWWDGRGWGSQVSDAGVSTVDPVTTPTSSSQVSPAALRIRHLAGSLRTFARVWEVLAIVAASVWTLVGLAVIATSDNGVLASGTVVGIGIGTFISAGTVWAIARTIRLVAEYIAADVGAPLG